MKKQGPVYLRPWEHTHIGREAYDPEDCIVDQTGWLPMAEIVARLDASGEILAERKRQMRYAYDVDATNMTDEELDELEPDPFRESSDPAELVDLIHKTEARLAQAEAAAVDKLKAAMEEQTQVEDEGAKTNAKTAEGAEKQPQNTAGKASDGVS